MSDLLQLLEANSNNPKKPSSLSKPAIVVICLAGGIATAVTLISVPFISPAFRKVCLPYVPATAPQIVNVLSALKHRSGTLVDLGSGDGRIVRAAASYGLTAVGVEINIWLVLYSRFVSLLKGHSSCTKYYRQNLWSFNLKPYSNVVVFGTEQMMPLVEQKCTNELEVGSVVVACRFPLPNLQPEKIIGEGIDTVWRYRISK